MEYLLNHPWGLGLLLLLQIFPHSGPQVLESLKIAHLLGKFIVQVGEVLLLNIVDQNLEIAFLSSELFKILRQLQDERLLLAFLRSLELLGEARERRRRSGR